MANMTTRRLDREYRQNPEFFHKGIPTLTLTNPLDTFFFERGMTIAYGSRATMNTPATVAYINYSAGAVHFRHFQPPAKRGKRTGPWLSRT